MNSTANLVPNSRQVLDCGSPLPLSNSTARSQSARGLAQSKTLVRILVVAGMLVAIGLVFTGCSKSDSSSTPKTFYTCGMHPQVIQDHPGNCPICGMKLAPIRKDSGATNANLSTISVDPVTRQSMGIRTLTVTRGPLRRTIRTVGMVEHSESAMADVTTKFKGWVEKLYVDATGQHVHHGDPLFEIYSPELYSAQTEYLLALKAGPGGNESLLKSARLKLKFMDISDEQIAELEQAQTPAKTLRIGAPIDGYVMEKMVVAGQMIEPGMKLYRLANHDTVWVQAQIYEQDLPYIRLGQDAEVTIASWPDIRFRGRVTFISPTLDEKTRTVMVRMEFHNPGHLLRPGMFATARITVEMSPSVLLVPDMAVLRSGDKNTVFVALDEGKFEPRAVVLGRTAEEDRDEVISGLREGERVVSSGQFMLDSESQLREAIQKMIEPGAGATSHQHPTTNEPATTVTNAVPAVAPEQVVYICPMPEHVAIEYSQPGKCSLCGMTLVPVSPELLAKIQPGGTLEGYTCPMPEHSNVHQDGPGKCPKCGMTLVPMMSLPKVEEPLATHQLYTCPMASHADVVSDKPGKCPKCGMELVPTSTVKHGRIAEANWQKEHAGHEH